MPSPFVIVPRGSTGASEPLDLDPAFGELAVHAADPRVTDLFLNGADGLFLDRGSGAEPVPGWSASEREVRDLAVRLIALGGRHLDDQAPCVDVRLASGVRVHAVLAPVATSGTAVSVRIPRVRAADLDDLCRLGAIDGAQRAWLEETVRARRNVLITGGTGTGKTTMLAALLAHVPHDERIVTIEDVAELRPRHPHHVSLEARQPNLEGVGAIGVARLVRESLRMRPDRLIVGECRGEEIRDLLTALNTGHDGGAGTLHASGLSDVPARLEALGALAGMDPPALARQAVSAFASVLHLVRERSGVRRLVQAGELWLDGEHLGIAEVRPW
ncbi:TadA family conjugal transfer-associated ATPase [Microbacterium capsulatum]|uniref:TadA family conjugal transfer-associated ATPase n=1 Tax=Microbacterium capsulatum TaxID=3041921 RepID=A0ABU0XGY0_9MICO|nr:TadA family conjugal transfer-associated ATPase [Microbacterium sp. ASV81]MDQ4214388.1 TadA family conjugal transfer-associated ATPase [Microbacterium sp. ASV81]